jgi:hypothetical protein
MGIASKLLLTTIFAAPPLGAQGNINADLRDIGDLSRYIHKTASYNEEIIPRKLVASMARQDQERVAATAQIKCPGGRDTSAQVTGNKEINTGKPVKVPYGELTGTTYFVPFTGDFLRAVKKAADGP